MLGIILVNLLFEIFSTSIYNLPKESSFKLPKRSNHLRVTLEYVYHRIKVTMIAYANVMRLEVFGTNLLVLPTPVLGSIPM